MVERWYKKGLVIGIIILFIGMGVQPAFAVETKSPIDSVEKVEDCDCQQVSDINLVKLKGDLNRLKVYTRILSMSSELNPMVQRRIEQLENLLSDLDNDNTRFWNFPFICWVLLFPIFVVASILARMPNPITEMFYYMITSFGAMFNCDWVPL
jgi:hypothetical protein